MIYVIKPSMTPGMGYDLHLNGSTQITKSFDTFKQAEQYANSDEASKNYPLWTPFTKKFWSGVLALLIISFFVGACFPK